MRFLIVVLLSVSACGSADDEFRCDYFAAGMCVSDETGSVAPWQVEEIVRLTEEKTAEHYSFVVNLPWALEKANTRLKFVSNPMASECHQVDQNMYECESWVWGYNADHNEYTEIRVYNPADRCVAWSALGHELLHSVAREYLNEDDGDYGHDDQWFFWDYHGRSSIEYQTEIAAAPIVCPK